MSQCSLPEMLDEEVANLTVQDPFSTRGQRSRSPSPNRPGNYIVLGYERVYLALCGLDVHPFKSTFCHFYQ